MNKFNKKSFFAIIGLVLVLAISLVLPLGTAFADYIEDVQTITNAIVDFNQLFNNTISRSNYNSIAISKNGPTYSFSGSFTGYSLRLGFNEGSPSIPIYNGHKYYLKYNLNVISGNTPQIQMFNSSGTVFDSTIDTHIFTATSNQTVSLGIFVNTSYTYNFNVTPVFIDLTQMFGVGNEPNLDQANELFVADYYPYNVGTPVAYDTIDAYTNGVNAYLSSTEYVISSLGFLSSVYAVNLSNAYSATDSQVTRDSVNNRVVVEPGASDVTPTLCLPFNYTIPTGTQITITGACATTQYNATYYLHFGLWGNGGEMIVIPQSMVAGTQGFLRSSTITFTLPMSVDRIYIMTTDDATWYLSNFEVGYYLTNVDTLRELGYADGVKYMQEQYSPNGALYQSIYMKGYNAYPTEDHFTFQKLIYSVIDVPVQAFTNLFDYDILGVNMKTFYLSLFTLAVIVTIIRLVL